jgi:uncharacterized protein (DUF1800 family)
MLELHTLGNASAYSERDVRQLSLLLTGFSYVRGWEAENNWNGGNQDNRGQMIYRHNWHEPGTRRILGRRYRGRGPRQLRQVIDDLSVHPMTARYICRKLVAHFISDNPTEDMIHPVEEAYLSSDGELREVYRALINLDFSWEMPLQKLRAPYEHLVAIYRAMDKSWSDDILGEALNALGFMHNFPWHWPAPDGYPDKEIFWIDPNTTRLRLLSLQRLIWRMFLNSDFQRDPVSLSNQLMEGWCSESTLEAVRSAGGDRNGCTVLFMSPEFLRR